MFTPKYIEEGRALAKAARKVINYRKDVARPEDLDRVRQNLAGLNEALKKRSSEGVQKAEKDLLPSLGKLQPLRDQSGIRENVELISCRDRSGAWDQGLLSPAIQDPDRFHATDSQRGDRAPYQTPPPNIIVRAFQFVTLGRTYEDVVCEEPTDTIDSISPTKVNTFWDGSVIRMSSGKIYRVGIDPRSLEDQMRVGPGPKF